MPENKPLLEDILDEYSPEDSNVSVRRVDAQKILNSTLETPDISKLAARSKGGGIVSSEKKLLSVINSFPLSFLLVKCEEKADVEEISKIPPKTFMGKAAGWLIPIIIIGLLVAGFIYGGKDAGITNIWIWIIWNGALAAIAAVPKVEIKLITRILPNWKSPFSTP